MITEEWINPHNLARHVYMGRIKERCECCGSFFVKLSCRSCGAETTGPKAASAGWKKQGYRRARRIDKEGIPDMVHFYTCQMCE
jgi:hypothetical protein